MDHQQGTPHICCGNSAPRSPAKGAHERTGPGLGNYFTSPPSTSPPPLGDKPSETSGGPTPRVLFNEEIGDPNDVAEIEVDYF